MTSGSASAAGPIGPWRGTFYPTGLAQRRELKHAAAHLTSIEINGTYCGSQKPEGFARWFDETPDSFVFAVKGPSFATKRRVLAEAGESIKRFFESGVMQLGHKLSPVNWHFMATKTSDPGDCAAFLALLPKSVEGVPIRHAFEARNESCCSPDFVALGREYQVAIVTACYSTFPPIADPAPRAGRGSPAGGSDDGGDSGRFRPSARRVPLCD